MITELFPELLQHGSLMVVPNDTLVVTCRLLDIVGETDTQDPQPVFFGIAAAIVGPSKVDYVRATILSADDHHLGIPVVEPGLYESVGILLPLDGVGRI
jgi:hypothetical protein